MRKRYIIAVYGCDDSTIIERELTDDELKLVQSIAKQVTEASEYDCMPIMEIETVDS